MITLISHVRFERGATESQLIFSFDCADPDNIAVSIPNNSHNSATAVSVSKDGAGANNQVMANTSPDAPEEKEKKSGFGRKEKSVLQTKLTRLAIQIGYAGEWGILGVYRYLHPDCLSGWSTCIHQHVYLQIGYTVYRYLHPDCLSGWSTCIHQHVYVQIGYAVYRYLHPHCLSEWSNRIHQHMSMRNTRTYMYMHTHTRTHTQTHKGLLCELCQDHLK